jgi:hypothetical protein
MCYFSFSTSFTKREVERLVGEVLLREKKGGARFLCLLLLHFLETVRITDNW